jgi:cytochrome c553
MQQRAWNKWLSATLAVVVLVLVAASRPAPAQGKNAEDLYLDKCAVCHGADGQSKTARGRKLKMKSVHETATKVTAEEMATVVAKGKPPNMDGYSKELSAEQIKQIVEHYRGLARK